jgi:hypothetical protein
MATTFDVTSYPLEASTRFIHQPRVARDTLDDGSPRIRVLGDEYAEIDLVFEPMNATTAQAFEGYIYTNIATEFDITHRGATYRGYLWSDLQTDDTLGGGTIFSIRFRGRRV